MVLKHRRKMVNSLLEFLILNYLTRGELCGYDILTLLHDRFRVLLSPGQLYPAIDHLASLGLIQKEKSGRMVLLRLSTQGDVLARAWKNELDAVQVQLSNVATRTVPVI